MVKRKRRRLKRSGGDSSSSSSSSSSSDDGEVAALVAGPQQASSQGRKAGGGRLRWRHSTGAGSNSSEESEAEIEALVASASASQPTPSASQHPPAPAPVPAISADAISISSSSSDSDLSSAERGQEPKRRRRIRKAGEASQSPPRPAAAVSVVTTPPSAASSRGSGRRRLTPPSISRGGEQAVLERAQGWVRGRNRLSELEEEEEEEEEGYGDDDEDGVGSFIASEHGEDEELEDGEVRCVCGAVSYDKATEADTLWVQCSNEECDAWVHGECFGIRKERHVPHKFLCHECDPAGKSRRGIIMPSASSHGGGGGGSSSSSSGKGKGKKKRKRARAPKDVEKAVELYERLERAYGPWGKYRAGDADEDEEDGALAQVTRRAIERFGLGEFARARGRFKESAFTPLMAAAAAGRVGAVRALLDAEAAAASSSSSASASAAGATPLALARDAEGRTAAAHAVAAAEASEAAVQAIVERLLEGCGDKRQRLLIKRDRSKRNILHVAATRGGADGGEEDAAACGEVMRFLIAQLGPEEAAALARQDDVTGRSALAMACVMGGEAECAALLEVTPPEVVKEALADPEKGNVTVLMAAVGKEFREVARRMVAIGGPELLGKKDSKGQTALHYACEIGDAGTASAILDVCPDLVHEPDDEQRYPLHFAAAAGKEDCVVALLQHGAAPDVKDEAGWSPLLYADFQGEQGCVLQLLAVRPESQLAILGGLLSGPLRGDPKVVKLLRSLTAVPSFSRFINRFVQQHMELLDSSLSFLLEGEEGAQLLDLGTKAAWLSRRLEAVRREALEEAFQGEMLGAHSHHYTDSEDEDLHEALVASRNAYRPVLGLSRDECWPGILRAAAGPRLVPSPAAFLRRNIMLQFVNEPGMGPGVEREVLELLAQGMASGSAGGILDLAPDHGSYLPRLPITKEVERGFYVAGLLAAHAILYRKTLSINFNPCFLKLVLQRSLALSDLQDLDPDFARNLDVLLQSDGAEHLCLSFTQPAAGAGGGEHGEVELCAGGREKEVTDANKDEYARLVLRHRTQGTYGRAADAMRRGICDVLKDRHGRLLRLYTAAELGTLVGGIHKVDPAEWEAHATYGGYTAESKQVQWFWTVVRVLSTEERALLLKFCTGSSRLPVDGFGGLHPAFLIHKTGYDERRPLPTSATCFNMLKLPDYPDSATLEKSLLLAIRFGAEGFAFT